MPSLQATDVQPVDDTRPLSKVDPALFMVFVLNSPILVRRRGLKSKSLKTSRFFCLAELLG